MSLPKSARNSAHRHRAAKWLTGLTAVIFVVAGASPASASSMSFHGGPSDASVVTQGLPNAAEHAVDDVQSARALAEFRAGNIVPRFEQENGARYEVYALPEGATFAFRVDAASGDPVSGSLIGGGYGDQGLFISLNSTDQGAIAAGAGYAVGAALCALPGVGQAACVVVGSVIAAATYYIGANGVCGGGRELRIYLQLLGYPECQ